MIEPDDSSQERCQHCGEWFEIEELEEITAIEGSVEEVSPGQYETLYGLIAVFICPDCSKKHHDEQAARLLSQ